MHSPKVNDRLYDATRLAEGRNPYGKIVRVLHRDEEIFVHFKGASVVYDLHPILDFANQAVARLCNIRIDGVLHHSSIRLTNPDMLLPGGDQVSYMFDQLTNYESSDGGEG